MDDLHQRRQPAKTAADGKELFCFGTDRKLVVMDVREDINKFEANSPRALFEMRLFVGFGALSSYEVAHDGQRFPVNTVVDESAPSPLTVVLSWTAGLKRCL